MSGRFRHCVPKTVWARYSADYDPSARLRPSDVLPLIDSAEVAKLAFACIPADEQADVLALLMVQTRT